MKRGNFRKTEPKPLVERAYQLARTGAFATVSEIANRLKREGYPTTLVDVHLEERAIRDDLARLCREAVRRLSRSG